MFLLLLEFRPTCAGRALIPQHPRAFLKQRAVLTAFSCSRTSLHAWYLTRSSVLSESRKPSACPVPSIRMLGLYGRDEKPVNINLLSIPEDLFLGSSALQGSRWVQAHKPGRVKRNFSAELPLKDAPTP